MRNAPSCRDAHTLPPRELAHMSPTSRGGYSDSIEQHRLCVTSSRASTMRVPRSPPPTSVAVTSAMRGNRSRDTRPEMRVRRLLFKLGYRYRLHRRDVPGRPDISFLSRRRIIFVHGCFWHQHPSDQCTLKAYPRTHLSYWGAKLFRNCERDREHQIELARRGWTALIVWECETKDTKMLARRVRAFLGPPSTTSSAAK
jgi:DNA mismatch endonuclease, patch repair protein